MAYSGSNAARHLSAYPQPASKPNLKVHKSKRRKQASVINARVVCAFGMIVTLLFLMMYCRVQLVEVSGEITALNKELYELESENTRLINAVESTLSMVNVGDKARNELGMNRLDKHQMVHIIIEQEDRIERTEHAPAASLGEKTQSWIGGVIGQIKEYLVDE